MVRAGRCLFVLVAVLLVLVVPASTRSAPLEISAATCDADVDNPDVYSVVWNAFSAATSSLYSCDWGVQPPYDGPTYENEQAAAAADPPPPAPVPVSLPTWRNLYDWPNGHGYAGWHSTTSRAGAYGIAQNLGGSSGLWLWPAGEQEYTGSDFAEWTYTAPGTTRIARVNLNFAYRNKLLAHHCLVVGLRTPAAAVAQHEWCTPANPPDSQRDVPVTLVDPSSNPTAKTLFFRIRVDCKGATSCSKHIPSLDPLQTAGTARLHAVDMTLVDDDAPVIVRAENLSIDQERYDVHLDVKDEGSGVKRVTLERSGAGVIAASDAPCDPTHGTPQLDARICPMTHSLDVTFDTSTLAEGVHSFIARATDFAGNAAVDTWSVRIDRSEPTPTAVVEFSTPTTVASALQWAHDHGVAPVAMASRIPAGDETLSLFMHVPDGASDAEIIDLTPADLFADLAESGESLSQYYVASPPIVAMEVSGAPAAFSLRWGSSRLYGSVTVRKAAGAHTADTTSVGKPPPPACPKPWWPDSGVIRTQQSQRTFRRGGRFPVELPMRYVYQGFSWSAANLARLKCDGDVTYEPDAAYTKFLGTYLGDEIGWDSVTNLPESYLDTRFKDPDCCSIYTIGTDDADQLLPRPRRYFTLIRTQEGDENVDLGRPIGQLGYHRFDHCPHFAAEYCVFSRPEGSENLMNRDPSTIWEHSVPGMDSWTH